MPEKDPNNWLAANDALPLFLGAAGGFVRYYSLIKSGREFKFMEFIGDMLCSVVAGWLLFLLAQGLDQNPQICAVCAAIGGNMGARAFQLVEVWVMKRGESSNDNARTKK